MPNKEKQKYQVETVTYLKVPTGEIYPIDYKNEKLRGKRKYDIKKPGKKGTIETTWGALKKDVYKKSVEDKNYHVTWKKPKTQVQKVVRIHPDGVQEITYFNPIKGGK